MLYLFFIPPSISYSCLPLHQILEVEGEIKEHSSVSATQNGRVNASYAHKKKRLDEEFERLLAAIEVKRDEISKLGESTAAKSRLRDLKEGQVVEYERQLVQILIEQQKAVLALLKETEEVEKGHRGVLKRARIPFPPPVCPSESDVATLFATGGPLCFSAE